MRSGPTVGRLQRCSHTSVVSHLLAGAAAQWVAVALIALLKLILCGTIPTPGATCCHHFATVS
jgi:hypothetical protein